MLFVFELNRDFVGYVFYIYIYLFWFAVSFLSNFFPFSSILTLQKRFAETMKRKKPIFPLVRALLRSVVVSHIERKERINYMNKHE